MYICIYILYIITISNYTYNNMYTLHTMTIRNALKSNIRSLYFDHKYVSYVECHVRSNIA